MTTTLLPDTNNNPVSLDMRFNPAQLKPYREVLKIVYDNPEFKTVYRTESNETILKMLAYFEAMREKSQELAREVIMEFPEKSNIDAYDIKELTDKFIINNLGAIKRLSKLPLDLQPAKESVEALTRLSFKTIISQN